jgi:hypothetical protein
MQKVKVILNFFKYYLTVAEMGKVIFKVGFLVLVQHCFIRRPSDSTVSEDAGIEPWTVATSTLAVRRSNHSASLIHNSTRFHPHSARSHPQLC